MRLRIHCHKCVFDDEKFNALPIPVQITSSSRYTINCPAGHETTVVLSSQSFEVLGEIALQAILDGYFRDAIGSFTASLERAYEAYVRISLKHSSKKQALVDEVWNSVAAQSERQLGLFIGIYAVETRQLAPLLPRRMVELRNAVVHKGHIPTEEEAILFGQHVSDIVMTLIHELRARCPNEMMELIGQTQMRGMPDEEELAAGGVMFMSYDVPYGFQSDDMQTDIAAAVAERRRERGDAKP